MQKKNLNKLVALALCGCISVGLANESVAADAAGSLFSMEEILTPFWEGGISYMESVLPVAEADGSIAPVALLYPIEEIVEVKSATLTIRYEEGKDYTVEDGKLVIDPDGAIPVLSYAEFHPQTGTAGFEDRNGGYVCWYEGSWFHSRQIVVTYKHAEGYDGYVPEGKGRLLPTLQEKFKGEELNVLVYGDSISTGGNSSGYPGIEVSPNMPIYPKLFVEGLKLQYGVETVNLYNPSVGGTDSAWGLSNLRGGVLDKYEDIDLAVLAFGMNDVTRDPEAFASNMSRMARGLTSKYPDVEVMIVATMLPNYDAVNFYGNQVNFYDALMKHEKEGVAIVNMTGVHAGLLEYKKYADMTGNNVNHANDYLARAYAQTLLKTLEISDYGVEEEPPVTSESASDSVEEETSESSVADSVDAQNSASESVGSDETPTSAPSSGSDRGCGGVTGGGALTALALAEGTMLFRKKKTLFCKKPKDE